MTAYISGFALGLSLILAIGAQNAFVLKQGLKKQHVFLVCSLCAVSDAILITFGVMGFGAFGACWRRRGRQILTSSILDRFLSVTYPNDRHAIL